jgi:hypothetical protein
MKTSVLLLALLFGASALAQEGVTRGDALRRREFRTFADVSLFVDPTGSDTNACTASGTAACLTVNGALSKLPKIIQHNVTINVAAGTYAGFTVSNFVFTAPTSSNLNFSIVGVMQNFTPATGTATGTLSTASNANSLGVVSDGAQTWTTDDLVGRFIRMTSGSQNGQRRAIFGNTSTSIETAPQWATLPLAGDTYVIETPATVFNTASSFSGVAGSSNAFFVLDTVELNSASGSTFFAACRSVDTQLSPRSSRLISTSGSVALLVTGCRLQGSSTGSASPIVLQSATGGALSVGTNSVWAGVQALAVSPAGNTASSVVTVTAQHAALWSGMYIRAFSTSAAQAMVSAAFTGSTPFLGGGGGVVAYAWVARCGASTQTAFALQGPAHVAQLSSTPPVVFSCGVGFDVQTGLTLGVAPTCVSTTTCVQVRNQGIVRVPSISSIAVTNDYNVGGVNYSEAFFSALSPRRIVAADGSILERP